MIRFIPVAILPLLCSPSLSQGLSKEVTEEITNVATAICGDFKYAGSRTQEQVNGSVRAKLDGLAGRLVDLGIEGAGSIDSDSYINVLRGHLGPELRDIRKCRLKIWDDMRGVISLPSSSFQENLGGSNLNGWSVFLPKGRTYQSVSSSAHGYKHYNSCVTQIAANPKIAVASSNENVGSPVRLGPFQSDADLNFFCYKIRYGDSSPQRPRTTFNVIPLQGERCRFRIEVEDGNPIGDSVDFNDLILNVDFCL
ncbi:MAG: hypothetical protein ACFBWO_09000 [Paracoccaceae bacterium]